MILKVTWILLILILSFTWIAQGENGKAQCFYPYEIIRTGEEFHIQDNLLYSRLLSRGAPLELGHGLNFTQRDHQGKKEYIIEALTNASGFSFITFNDSTTIPIKIEKRYAVEFSYSAGLEQDLHKIYVAGAFNNWNSGLNMLTENGKGVYKTTLYLERGLYQYKFVVDGRWILDPANSQKMDDNFGGFNSVISVGNKEDGKNCPKLVKWDVTHNEDGSMKLTFLYVCENIHKTTETMCGIPSILALFDNRKLPDKLIQVEPVKCNPNYAPRQYYWTRFTIPEKLGGSGKHALLILTSDPAGNVSNDELIIICNGEPVGIGNQNTALKIVDWRDAVIYFLLVDRFYDGNPENSKPIIDPAINQVVNFLGGDIAGVNQKLREGYFQSLGINVIWMSPLYKAPDHGEADFNDNSMKFTGYHGYWPVSSRSMEPRFGTMEELKMFAQSCHDNDMRIILDFVANHVHEEHPLYSEHPEWFSPFLLADGRPNLRLWEEQRLSTWFDRFLPDINYTGNQAAVDLFCDNALFWLKEACIDGFRHDAVKHVDINFWKQLSMKIMDEAEIPGQKEIFQVGESFGSRAFIRSFTGPGLLSSQFDFPLYFDAREIFGSRKSSFKNLLESLELSLSAFGSSSLMVNLIGNHDTARFISYASGELVFSDNVNSAEWNKKIMVFDEEAFKRHRLFLTFLITIPGIPMIYYGDEFGMAGAGDPDNRRQMRFPGNLFKNERITLEYTSKLVWLRRNHPCLRYGDFIPVQADEETFVYLRNYFDEVILIAMNRSQEEKNLEIKLPLLPCSSEISMDLLTGEQVKATKNHSKLSPMKLMLNVPANGVRLLSIAHD